MCVVIDSAVWFKLYCGGLHIKALQLGEQVCSVDYVVRKELLVPSGETLKQQGLRVEEVGGKSVDQARTWREEYPELKLTVADVFCLALAWERGWRLATHDCRLATLAKSKSVGVPVLCVVEVMRMMAEAGILTEDDIRKFKHGMHRNKEPYDKRKLRDVAKTIKTAKL